MFCCGSDTHKFCCTKKDQILEEEMEGLTVMIGVLVGASTAILLLTIISCVCCPWCPNYNKKDMEKFKGTSYKLYLNSHLVLIPRFHVQAAPPRQL